MDLPKIQRLFAAAAIYACCSVCFAQRPAAQSNASAVAKSLSLKNFNGVILVASGRHANPTISAVGIANAESRVLATRDTRYQIGSTSKWMTTIVVLRLVDRKIITLDKPIGYWLPDLPEATKNRVTLRHLLSNTSGIPNGVMDSYRKDPVKTSGDLPAIKAAYVYGSGTLNSEPGKVWDYSLTNWVLVRAILEKASGKSFASLIRDELVHPLKLKGTGIPFADFEDMPLAAIGYTSLSPVPQRKANKIPSYAAASGTFYSTVDDLRRVADRVSQGNFLSVSSRRELTTVMVLDQGYALGGRVVSLSEGSNRKIYWEPGEAGMFRALLAYDPKNGACVVILNNTGLSPDDLGKAARQALQNLHSRRGTVNLTHK